MTGLQIASELNYVAGHMQGIAMALKSMYDVDVEMLLKDSQKIILIANQIEGLEENHE